MKRITDVVLLSLGVCNVLVYAYYMCEIWSWGDAVLNAEVLHIQTRDIPLDFPQSVLTTSVTAMVFLGAFPLVPGFRSRWRGWAWLLTMIVIGLYALSELPHSGRLPGMAIEYWLWALCLGIAWLILSHPGWANRKREIA